MTLTQRLTRAGATFIVFGVAAAFVPTNSNAFSATDGCMLTGHRDSVGNSQGDMVTSYSFNSSNTLTLTGFSESGATITSVTAGSTGFSNTFAGSQVTTSRTVGAGLESVTVAFSDGHTVTYTVS